MNKSYKFTVGASMLKKADGYLPMNSIYPRYIVKTMVFPATKRSGITDYVKPIEHDFNPDLCIFHADTNN